jgi:mannosyltransferase
MEAAGATARAGLTAFLDPVREVVRARSRAFWVVAGLTLLAAGLRFVTLDWQAYHHDEIVTASRILRSDFWHAMEAVGFSESAPPLYYAVAWAWTQLTGTGEFGLRSVSALAGVATVPVAYLIGAELRDRRAGIATAALVAVNPMLIWYSQEARSYALLSLLTAVSLLYFLRSLERGGRRDATRWGIASGLALATHYFALFPIALEGAWLLWRRGRSALAGAGVVAAFCLLLAPLAIHQMLEGRAEWIGGRSLGHRLWETGVTFTVGEVGEIIARPVHPLLAAVPLAAVLAALLLLMLRGAARERLAGRRMLAIGAATIVVPVVLGLLVPSKDYVLARNLFPALVPLLAAVGVAVTLRGARRAGLLLGAVLLAYSLGFNVAAAVSPSLQRPDWDAVAERLGEPEHSRAMVTWRLGQASLRYYLSTGSFQVGPSDGFRWWVHEVAFISDGPAPPVSPDLVGPRFRQIAHEEVGRLQIRRYALPGDDLAYLRLRAVDDPDLNWRSNSALLDGIGP